MSYFYLYRILEVSILMLIIILVAASPAFAGDLSPITSVLETLVNFLTGTFARLVAILAVVGVGALFLMGRLEMRWALTVVLGIAIIFGAAQIVDALYVA